MFYLNIFYRAPFHRQQIIFFVNQTPVNNLYNVIRYETVSAVDEFQSDLAFTDSALSGDQHTFGTVSVFDAEYIAN